MSRFFMHGISPAPRDTLALTGENARHGAMVLRLSQGDKVIICDCAGTDYTCIIKSVGKSELLAEVLSSSQNPCEPSLHVHLFTSLIKSDKLEYVVQKAVELGVYAIHPFQSENSVARISGNAQEKTTRLMKISEGAAKQSGRGIIPLVKHPLTFKEVLSEVTKIKPDKALVAHEGSDIPLKKRMTALGISKAAIFIGPEGGFSNNEIATFEQAGIQHFSLGKRVLRAETAALAALTCIMYETGE